MIKTTVQPRVTLLFFACALLASFVSHAATKVDVVKVKKQHAYQTLSVPASVAAKNNSELSFGVVGRLSSFEYDVGDSIDANTTIALLDTRQIDASIESLNAQQASLKATLKDERQQLEELQRLAKTDFVAQSELRRARAAVAVAEADLAEVTARLNERQVNQDYHQLKVPFNAVIAERLVNVGEWVTEDQPAFRVIQIDDMYVDAYLAQRYLHEIDSSTDVSIESEGRSINATISSIVPYINPNDRTFLIRLTPESPDGLVIGSAVNANITLRSSSPKLTVPQDAVIRYSDGRTSVWVVENNNGKQVAREKLVELGQQFNGWIVIESSLNEGDNVVVRGNESLSDGEVVTPTSSEDYQ
ncbi:efflux RND transporter periplasmic adaptor subunit [Idiomarina piscisalsi]|uniref:efflux RND transporter periplasmic adaptor subunit n=1 Tax=Idiomarina piscisalsi TaxID=1096243 RepID=UPI00137F071E|nr:efflux RND transporter periplasmic adaptor subunit [Idiomarina piscisalsi]MTJ01227.1 efflux RND transporter periplasmic adaptor subunit [Idiomarina piscisalsi]